MQQQHLGVREEYFSLTAGRAVRWVRAKDTVRKAQARHELPTLIYKHEYLSVYLSLSPFPQTDTSFSATCIAKCWWLNLSGALVGCLVLLWLEKGDRVDWTGVIVCYKGLGYTKVVLKLLFSVINSGKLRSEMVSWSPQRTGSSTKWFISSEDDLLFGKDIHSPLILKESKCPAWAVSSLLNS